MRNSSLGNRYFGRCLHRAMADRYNLSVRLRNGFMVTGLVRKLEGDTASLQCYVYQFSGQRRAEVTESMMFTVGIRDIVQLTTPFDALPLPAAKSPSRLVRICGWLL